MSTTTFYYNFWKPAIADITKEKQTKSKLYSLEICLMKLVLSFIDYPCIYDEAEAGFPPYPEGQLKKNGVAIYYDPEKAVLASIRGNKKWKLSETRYDRYWGVNRYIQHYITPDFGYFGEAVKLATSLRNDVALKSITEKCSGNTDRLDVLQSLTFARMGNYTEFWEHTSNILFDMYAVPLLIAVGQGGNLKIIEIIYALNHPFVKRNLLIGSLWSGNKNLFDEYEEKFGRIEDYVDDLLPEAVIGGNIELVKEMWLRGTSERNIERAFEKAVEIGRLDIAKYIYYKGVPKGYLDLRHNKYMAKKSGVYKLVSWLEELITEHLCS